MLRAVSEFGKRTIDNATICIQCYKHLHIRMCLLRLLDVKISASFLMVLNFGSKFAFARHGRFCIKFITSSQRTLCKLSIDEWPNKVTSLNATVRKWIIYICFKKFRPSAMSKENIEM